MRCMEVDWEKLLTEEGLIRYDFTSKDVFELEKEYLQAENRAHRNKGSSSTVTLVAVSVSVADH